MCNSNLTKYCHDTKTTAEWLEHISHSHKSEEKLSYTKVNNALCLPDCAKIRTCFCGGVFDENGNPVDSSFQRVGRETAQKLYETFAKAPKSKIQGTAVYLGQYRNQWGSFLVDSISRLWYGMENPQEHKYVFLATQVVLGGIHKNAYRFLEHLGIKKEQVIYITEPTVFETLIIPEMSYVPFGTSGEEPRWHQEYLDTVHRVTDSVMKDATASLPDKVYFSRGKFSKNQKTDFGEELISAVMQENGYYVVYPEEHTLEEQIMYVNCCKEFASVGGSCAHNVIFSKTAPRMVLFNRMNGYQWHQWMLDEMAGVEPITYVDAYSEPFRAVFSTTISGPYLFWLNKNVKRFALERDFELPRGGWLRRKQCSILFRYTARVCRTILSKIKKRLLK